MISEQIEEYLEAIGRLEERGERITTSSLARERQVAPPSATEMLGRLSERGLVIYKARGEVSLTEEGRAMARSVMRRHRLWERFLHDVLGVHWDRVHGEACKLEHATSVEVERGLARAVSDSTTCPHGHAIPGPDGTSTPADTIPLLDLSPQLKARVMSVREEDPALLRQMSRVGLKPGVLVEVQPSESGEGEQALLIGGKSCSVRREVAAGVRVAPIESPDPARCVPLAQLSAGETGAVHQFSAGKSFLARCLALGFTPGTPVTVIQNPRSGPLLVTVRDTRVALGKGEAQKILVDRR